MSNPLEAWVRGVRGQAAIELQPWDEIIAEHRFAELMLVVMEEETRRLYDRAVLSFGFWTGVSEFADRFMHRSHRVKEERFFFPMLARASNEQDRAKVKEFHAQHERAHDLTDVLCAGIDEGDWEKVLRASMLYLSGMRTHMKDEEDRLGQLGRTLDPGEAEAARRGFAEVEAAAFGNRSRGYFLGMAVALYEHCELELPAELRE